ncbi:MAG: hypothetical protein WCO06_02890 [Candidatus Roizmanbacteria bacterium]
MNFTRIVSIMVGLYFLSAYGNYTSGTKMVDTSTSATMIGSIAGILIALFIIALLIDLMLKYTWDKRKK